jgi:ABC-type glycerol-3-phosphate transport system permease component
MSGYVTGDITRYGPLMAGPVVATLPVLAVFLFAQPLDRRVPATSGVR